MSSEQHYSSVVDTNVYFSLLKIGVPFTSSFQNISPCAAYISK
jgi:hypothetical protein